MIGEAFQFKNSEYALLEFKPAPELVGFWIVKEHKIWLGVIVQNKGQWQPYYLDENRDNHKIEGLLDTIEESIAEIEKVYKMNVDLTEEQEKIKEEKVVSLDEYREYRRKKLERENLVKD